MFRLILARHGETDWNVQRRIQGGSSDVPLNAVGRKQANSIGIALRQRQVQAIFSSPQVRAMDTARAIASHHRIEVVAVPALREIEAGEFEGRMVDALEVSLSHFLLADGKGELPRMPSGEGLTELRARAWPAIEGIIAGRSSGDVVVVSHYFTVLVIICSALGLPLTSLRQLRTSTGSISTIGFGQLGSILLSLNDICHLEGDSR